MHPVRFASLSLSTRYTLDTIAREKAAAVPRYDAHTYTTWLRCVSCYDGDTFTAVVPASVGTDRGWPCGGGGDRSANGLFSFKCRVVGYDSPEMKVSLKELDRVAIKAAAVRAKERLAELILHKVFRASINGTDKYGRLLVVFTVKGANGRPASISDLMIGEGHGYAYQGGTKQKGGRAVEGGENKSAARV